MCLSCFSSVCLRREQQPWTEEKRPGFRLISQLNRWPLDPIPLLLSLFFPLSLGLLYPSLTVTNNSVLCLFAISLGYITSWFLSVVNLCLICNISIIPFFFLPLKHWNRGPESQLQSLITHFFVFLCSFSLLFSVCNINRYWLTQL